MKHDMQLDSNAPDKPQAFEYSYIYMSVIFLFK